MPTREDAQHSASPTASSPRVIFRATLVVIATVALALLAWWLLQQVRVVVSMLVVSLLLSFGLEPGVNWLARKGWRRGPATMLVLLFGLVVAAGLLAAMVPLVVSQVQALVELVPRWIESASDLADRWFGIEIDVSQAIRGTADLPSRVADVAGNLAGGVLGVGSAVIEMLFQALSIALFTFYMVAEGPKMRRNVCSLLPPHRQREVLRAWDLAIAKMGAYVYSRMLLAAVSATLSYIVFLVVGVPFPIALALWLGLVSQFVPTVGTYLGAALPLLAALTVSVGAAVAVVVYAALYQQLENYVLAPRLTARTMSLHPAVAFGAAIAGAGIGGLAGAFFSIPVVAVAQAFVSTYLERHEVVADELTRDASSHPEPALDRSGSPPAE
jgi:predicted PurR-regulated permease PerM